MGGRAAGPQLLLSRQPQGRVHSAVNLTLVSDPRKKYKSWKPFGGPAVGEKTTPYLTYHRMRAAMTNIHPIKARK